MNPLFVQNVKIALLREGARTPTYAHPGDAGADLYYCPTVEGEVLTIRPNTWRLVPTGIAIAIPAGWVGLVHPRSGLAAKSGISVLNAPGTVDSGYRGEIQVNLFNHSRTAFDVKPGDRIAQILFQEVWFANWKLVESFEDTVRGANGHGSTGV